MKNTARLISVVSLFCFMAGNVWATSCPEDPATYSNDTRQAILPCVEIPLYTDIAGSPLEFLGLYSVVLEIPFGFSDFEAKDLTFLEILDTPNPIHARFNPDNGVLDVPRIDVPTIVPLFGGGNAAGPTLYCSASLQQSELRPEVLILKEFDCGLPDGVPALPKSCRESKVNDPSAEDGLYDIDPDGEGGNEPFTVYCDMTTDDGGWTLVFRHDASEGYFLTVAEASNVNQGAPGLSTKKYSILNKLDYFKRDSKFQFRINWPGYILRNIWSQTSNPTEDVNVSGYLDISVDSTSNYWGGLELNNNSASYLDGSVNHGNWYYAIGSYVPWGSTEGCYNGIPASDTVAGSGCGVQAVELWVK